MNFGDIRNHLDEFARRLRKIDDNTKCIACNGGGGSTGGDVTISNPGDVTSPIIDALTNPSSFITHTTGAGTNTSIPAGYKSIAITKTNSTGTVNITLGDSSIFPLTSQNEIFADAASQYYQLPGYTIATSDGGTWKWHGIQ